MVRRTTYVSSGTSRGNEPTRFPALSPESLGGGPAADAEELPCLVGGRYRTAELAGDAYDPGDQLLVRCELAFAVVEVVLEPHPDVSAHRDGDRGERELHAADPGDRPGAAGRERAHAVDEVLDRGLEPARDAEHEVDVRRERDRALGGEPLRVREVAEIEDLELRGDAECGDLRGDPTHDRKAVLEDIVAEVDRAAGERRHLRPQRERRRALGGRHPDRPAGRELHDEIARAADRVVRRAEPLDVVRV